MTTLTFAPAAPAPAVVPVGASAAVAVRPPAWFAPMWRCDPLFPVLLGMDLGEIEVALLASGAPYTALDPFRGVSLDQAVGLVLAGLRRIGLAEVRYLAAEWLRVNRRFLALPADRVRDRAWDLALADVRGGHLRGTRRQNAAIGMAYRVYHGGIRHDQPSNLVADTGRCQARYCLNCRPEAHR